MAGKRFTVRSRSIRWREGRCKGRPGSSPRPPSKPRPVLDVVIAVGASLVAAFFVLCMAFSLLGAYGTPLYIGYGVMMSLVTGGCLVFGPRDRAGLMIAGGLGVLCVAGTLILYGVRADVHYHPHANERPAATGKRE